MTVQFSTPVRNARADAMETAIGASPTLEMRTGAQPANCAAADSGTLVASMTLPADWLADGSAGAKSKLGTWQDLSADNSGIIAHWRVKQGATCHAQGSAGEAGSGADMILDNADVNAGQQVVVNSWTLTEGNA